MAVQRNPQAKAYPKKQAKAYPQKLYYKINEVAQITGLKSHVLRYWETEFKALSPEKDENDQRRYRPKDVDLVLEIKRLLYDEGFTIKGARLQLKNHSKHPTPLMIDVTSHKNNGTGRSKSKIKKVQKQVNLVRKELADLCAYLGI